MTATWAARSPEQRATARDDKDDVMLSERLERRLAPNTRSARSAAHLAWRGLAQACQLRCDLLIPLAIALVSRGIILLGADLLLRFALAGRLGPARYAGALTSWEQKDALWYLAIARGGYDYSPTQASRANFFPLYPSLISLGAPVAQAARLPTPYLLTGMLLSWALFAAACVALYRLALARFDRHVALGATLLLATFPFSLYYGAVYTESIYLALAVGAFLAVDRRRWWIAGALAGLASATRPPGLLIGACVALAYLLDWRRTRHPLRSDALALGLAPLGALAYLAYCWARWGDPLAYAKTSAAGWHGGHMQGAALGLLWRALSNPVAWLTPPDLTASVAFIAILLAIGFFALTPLIWRRLGPAYALFVAASVLTPLLDFPTFNSLGRYLSVIFPVFILLALWLRARPRLLWRLASVGLLCVTLLASCFIAGYGLS